ncbi:GerMN domain-containing protein [Micromonospora mirobrigensis]|uniref:Sporulation and spore germination n=1 Tax=Micromonospora mirobrigensis TaxID=262898 RepID=A0A1C4WRP8_9ACTN|nr:GerMN domain-containing protein [Micromonospora mirobrigensis]SCE98925.1 Sporulation and spore germination [Micromonospora mirobrigensis]
MSRRLAALLTVALLAGCGVPVDDRPRPVQAPPGPFPTAGTGSPSVAAGPVDETLCFVRDDGLDTVVRQVQALPALDVHLQRLLAGPDGPERDRGLATALPGTLTVTGARLAGRLAEVTVQPVGEEIGRSDEILAYGQIVCTLTARGDVDRVSFRRGDRPLEVPKADGSLSREPLTGADYRPLLRKR